MPLLDHERIIEDRWVRIPDGTPLPANTPKVVTLDRLLGEDGDYLYDCACPLGVELAPGQTVEPLEPWLDRLSLVILPFPVFSDGRAFSAAAMLRQHYGFKGEIRATGNVLVDQYQFMRRVGFSTFEVAEGRPFESWLAARNEVRFAYQHDPIGKVAENIWTARRLAQARVA